MFSLLVELIELAAHFIIIALALVFHLALWIGLITLIIYILTSIFN